MNIPTWVDIALLLLFGTINLIFSQIAKQVAVRAFYLVIGVSGIVCGLILLQALDPVHIVR